MLAIDVASRSIVVDLCSIVVALRSIDVALGNKVSVGRNILVVQTLIHKRDMQKRDQDYFI